MPRPTKEGLYKPKGSPNWYCRFYAPSGKLIRTTTGETNHEKALIAYNRLRIEAGNSPDDAATITVNTVLDMYHHIRGQFLRGQHGYQTGIKAILNFYNEVPWEELDTRGGDFNLRKYASYRQQGHQVKPATVNKEIGILSAAANVAIEEGLNITNPCPGKKLKVSQFQYHWLTLEQAAALLEAATPKPGEYRISEHLYLWLIIALSTGMRMSEILKLQIHDIHLDRHEIWLATSKSDQPHTIPMKSQVEARIRARIEHCRALNTTWLFCNPHTRRPIQSIIGPYKKACIRAGIPITNKKQGISGIRVHDTRHSVATWLVREGTPLERVQDLLNHSDIRTTQKYAHHAPDARRATVDKLPTIE